MGVLEQLEQALQAETFCPCCGSPVGVYTADEGTNSYEPMIRAADAGALLAVAQAADRVANWNEDRIVPTVNCPDIGVAIRMLRAAVASLETP